MRIVPRSPAFPRLGLTRCPVPAADELLMRCQMQLEATGSFEPSGLPPGTPLHTGHVIPTPPGVAEHLFPPPPPRAPEMSYRLSSAGAGGGGGGGGGGVAPASALPPPPPPTYGVPHVEAVAPPLPEAGMGAVPAAATAATMHSAAAMASTEPPERYCYCNRPAFGEMVGCDNEDCPVGGGWFHLECVGLHAAPEGDWFCPTCARQKGIVMPGSEPAYYKRQRSA